MSFRPNVHDELTIDGVTYRIAEHPAAPGIPYGQEGRAGIVYQLLPSPTGRGAEGEGAMALKVFRARFRTPALVSQAEKLAAFADLPGLTVCRRTVLTRAQNADLLRQHPDLIYAVLMPWIEGPTWTEVMLEKRPLTPQQALDLARAFADILSRMEQNGIAHCDLSGPNVLLPMLAGQTADRRPQTAYRPPSAVELVDVEGLYAPGLPRPEALPSGSSGYAHRTARKGLWGPTADRFAGAVLLAEMLGWGDESVREACYGETYFDPAEMPGQGSANPPRYRTLLSALARHYGQPVADLFERAWTSETLADCPTFGEWLVALPEHPVGRTFSPSASATESTAGEETTSVQDNAVIESTAEIRAFMQAARRMEDKHDLDSALKLYRQALELAQADPSLRSLAREIELTVQDVEKRVAAQASRPQPAISPLPPGAPFGEDKGPGVREQPRRLSHTLDLALLLQWMIANLAGFLVGLVVVTSIAIAGNYIGLWRISFAGEPQTANEIVNMNSGDLVPVTATTGLIYGITMGASMGIAQWIILRTRIKVRYWIVATTVGMSIGWTLLLPFVTYTANVDRQYATSPALVDFLVLPVMILPGIITGFGQWLILRRQMKRAGLWILAYITDVFTCGLCGFFSTISTGFLLALLLRQSRPETKGDAR
jgi:hypothetical protein